MFLRLPRGRLGSSLCSVRTPLHPAGHEEWRRRSKSRQRSDKRTTSKREKNFRRKSPDESLLSLRPNPSDGDGTRVPVLPPSPSFPSESGLRPLS